MNRNDKDFNKFHKENPKIYDHLRSFPTVGSLHYPGQEENEAIR